MRFASQIRSVFLLPARLGEMLLDGLGYCLAPCLIGDEVLIADSDFHRTEPAKCRENPDNDAPFSNPAKVILSLEGGDA